MPGPRRRRFFAEEPAQGRVAGGLAGIFCRRRRCWNLTPLKKSGAKGGVEDGRGCGNLQARHFGRRRNPQRDSVRSPEAKVKPNQDTARRTFPLTAPGRPYALDNFMKVVSSIKSAKKRHPDCQVVRRRGKIYVINKTDPR